MVALSLTLIVSTVPEPWAWNAHTMCLDPDFHNFLVFLANKTQNLPCSHSAPLPAVASACVLAVGLFIV